MEQSVSVITKHPKILEIVKEKDTAVSNQVLRFVDDYRNHSAATFFSNNIPVIVSADDPSFWEVTPLSHDFYIVFLGIASAESDLHKYTNKACDEFLKI